MNPLRIAGHILLWLGFLAGAFLAVRNVEVAGATWSTIEWPKYTLALAVGVAGVVLLRRTQRRAMRHADKLQSDIKVLEVSIKDLLAELATLIQGKSELSVFTVHQLIDARMVEKINYFVDARETLIYTYGLRQYAQLMTDFSIAERLINRAWSASADGYVDEVWLSLDRAEGKLRAVDANLLLYKKEQFSG